MVDLCPICMAPKPETECSQCGYENGNGWEALIEKQLEDGERRGERQ